MLFRQLIDPETSTYSYLLADHDSHEAVLIDPVKGQVPRDLQLVAELGLSLRYTLETHVHADHITGAHEIRTQVGTRSVVAAVGGAACGNLHVTDGDRIEFGRYALIVRTTAGHTNGCLSFVLDDHSMVFTGDALLIRGCGRTDFQRGDPRQLFRSVHTKILTLPPTTKIYPGHDYRGHTVSTVAEELAHNPRLGANRSEDSFVALMGALKLATPRHMDLAVPANLNCGVAASPSDEGRPFVPTKVAQVEPEWVADNIDDLYLVDVRQPQQMHGPPGRIDGSVCVPIDDLKQVALSWERTRPIVVVCHSGERSLQAANTLQGLGFCEVASMRGGLMAWGKARLPTSIS